MPTTTKPDKAIFQFPLTAGYVNCDEQLRNICFSQMGRSRFYAVLGYIDGLRDAGKAEFAEAMLQDFSDRLKYLDNYGGEKEVSLGAGIEKAVPAYKIMLHDDGTRHGFSIGWFRMSGTESTDKSLSSHPDLWNNYSTTASRYDPAVGTKTFYYEFAFNGGLLYHGAGGEETFSVCLNQPRFWSIHT